MRINGKKEEPRMNPERFKNSPSGRLLKVGEGEAAYWAFVPHRLPPALSIEKELICILSDADRALGELVYRAHELFQKQEAREKRRLLNFLLSNCTWKNVELEVTCRQPFYILAEMDREHEKKKAAYPSKGDLFDNWLPGQDSVTTVETFCFSLRHLPFGFLTQRVRAAFPPTWSAESSLLVLQKGILANKKAHTHVRASLFTGSPGRTRTCNLVVNSR
jgi:hypothetical protein